VLLTGTQKTVEESWKACVTCELIQRWQLSPSATLAVPRHCSGGVWAPAARETREKSVNELVDVTPTHTGLARPARTRKRPQRAARASHEWGSLSRCFIGPYSCGPGLVDVQRE